MRMPPQGIVSLPALNIYGNRHVRALGNRLAAGVEPACILLQGDSTGDGSTDWFYTAMQWFSRKYPSYSFRHRVWTDANQCYEGALEIQTGTAGDAYAGMTGVSGDYISTPDSVPLSITGDLEIQARVALDAWMPGSGVYSFVSKFGSSVTRGFDFGVDGTTGCLYLLWSADGSTLISKPSTSAPTVSDGQTLQVRVTLDVDNGAGGNDVKFYTIVAGNWVQLGDTVTTAGTTSIYNNAVAVELGSRGGGASNFWAGKFYYAEIRSGISGKIVGSPDLDLAFPVGTTTFLDGEANTWTVNGNVTVANGSPGVILLNASKPGAAIAYSTDGTRFTAQTPIEPQLAFISYSHNEGETIDYQSTYEGLATQLTTKYANTGVVCVTQNPQLSPRTTAQINAHAQRNRQIAMLAAVNDYGLVDVYRAMSETGSVSDYVDGADGVHPTAAGFAFWKDQVIKFLQPAAA